jgi:hypothetical protein
VAVGILKATLVLSAIGLGVAGGISYSAAQGATTDVAYVEAVSGRVVASTDGKPVLLDVLDVIGDRTRLDLLANSELRICHFRTHKLLTLKGPLRATISASGVTAEGGKPVDTSAETCVTPVVSTFQGGIVSRTTAVTTTKVPLRPIIKVVNRGAKAIRKITLWDGTHQTVLATFDRNTARPILDDGKSYLLVVERSDGSELNTMLQASAAAETIPLIFVIR